MSGFKRDYTMADDKVYTKYGKIVSMMDDLQSSGCFEATYSQPVYRIVVTGPNGSGKDSLINCLFGYPFLPPNCRSKRQMEIRFVHSLEDVSPMVQIEEIKKTFTNFNECAKFVADLQNASNDSNQNMSIRMNLTTNTSADLYVISTCEQDIGNPNDKSLLREALAPSCNFIILVMEAKTLNDDQIQVRDHWFDLIKNYDPELKRTLVVFSKCDLLPNNFDFNKIKRFLKDKNDLFNPEYGFVAVKTNFPSHLEPSDQSRLEREYFCNHKVFQYLSINDFFTLDTVAEKITKWIYETKEFKKNLVSAYSKLQDRMKFVESELQKYGNEFLDFSSQSKDLYLQSMINVFCETVEKIFSGKCEIEEYNLSNTKLNRLYTDFLCEYIDFNPSTTFKNKEIIDIIQKSEGSYLSGFPSGDVIYALLDKKFEDLRNELENFLDKIYTTVNQLIKNIVNRYFARFPKALSSIEELILSFLEQEFNKTKKLQIDLAEMNFVYLYVDEISDKYKGLIQNSLLRRGFTNNQNNLNNNNNLQNNNFPFKDNKDISFFKSNKDHDSYYQGLADYVKSLVDFIYAEIIRDLREYIPKSTRNFFIKSLKSNMRFYLLQYISKNPEFCQELEEDQEVAQKRTYYIDAQKKLKKINKIVEYDVQISKIVKGDNIKSIDTILQSQGINAQNSNNIEELETHSSKNLSVKSQNNSIFGIPPKMDNNPSTKVQNSNQNKPNISSAAKSNLFGNNPKTTIGKKPNATNLFGNPNTTTNANKQAPNNLFGNTSANTNKPAINNLFGNPNTSKQTANNLYGNSNANKQTNNNLFGNNNNKQANNNLFGNSKTTIKKNPQNNNLFGTPNQGTNRNNNLFGNANQQNQQKKTDVKVGLNMDKSGNVSGIKVSGNIDPKDAYNFYQTNKQYMPSGQQMLSGAMAVNNFMNNQNNNNTGNKNSSLGNLFGTNK